MHIAVSVQFSSVVSTSSWRHGLPHSCPSPSPIAYSNSCPLSRWCHPTVSSSVVPFFSCLQSFPVSGSFPVSQFFASGGQSIGANLTMNIQDWFPVGWTGWISLLSLSRVFSNTTVKKHQFFSVYCSIHVYNTYSEYILSFKILFPPSFFLLCMLECRAL